MNSENVENRTLSFPPVENSDKYTLLWDNVNTLSIPGTEEEATSHSPSLSTLAYNKDKKLDGVTNTQSSKDPPIHNSSVFNISWGGNDTAPCELHSDIKEEPEPKLSRPLPKPRGIRRLPEPEPSEDGTVDEDVLKRRKNTDAARRSRMKKLLKVDQLETQVAELQAENAKLVLSNAVLESEKKGLNAKEIEYKKRINYLEEVMKNYGWQE